MVIFDLKHAARTLCPRAIEVLAEALHHKDVRVRLIAAGIAFECGYGKPEQRSDIAVTHKFAIVSQAMEESEWLKRRGSRNPALLAPPERSLRDDDDPDRKPN
jgi:hypothetical protein